LVFVHHWLLSAVCGDTEAGLDAVFAPQLNGLDCEQQRT
jgi:hypothetical protein